MPSNILGLAILGDAILGDTTTDTSTVSKLGSINLDDNAWWPDELDWSPVRQATTRTLGGSLVVESALARYGRPITLAGLVLDRATLEVLRDMSDTPGATYTLTIPDGRQYTVMWRHADEAISYTPDETLASYGPANEYTCTLRFFEVAP